MSIQSSNAYHKSGEWRESARLRPKRDGKSSALNLNFELLRIYSPASADRAKRIRPAKLRHGTGDPNWEPKKAALPLLSPGLFC
jgi:hypothetical protein